MNAWLAALGYFVCYVPYAALTKWLTDDTGDSPPGRFTQGVGEVDFARHLQALPQGPDMPEGPAQAGGAALDDAHLGVARGEQVLLRVTAHR